jgi:uncharacterized protein
MRPHGPSCAGNKRSGCILCVRLKPAASREKIVSVGAHEVGIAVTAAPVEGKANEAMLRLLAKTLGIPKSSVTLRTGASSRIKLVDIAVMTKEEILKRLQETID